MSEHPIEGLMLTAMNSIEDMIDVNTIVGEPIETSNGIVIIPISKVSFGFAAGGSEFKGETVDEYKKKDKDESIQYRLPFGGGSGAGVSINPISFLIVQQDKVKLLPVTHTSCVDKILDYIPEVIDKLEEKMNLKNENQNIESSNKKGNNQKEPKTEQPKKAKLNKTSKTAAENLEKQYMRNKKEEAVQELENMFENEYDDE